ncbi:gustatory receptor 32a isoform 1-T2 [Glossina fuscipes fuscipes]
MYFKVRSPKSQVVRKWSAKVKPISQENYTILNDLRIIMFPLKIISLIPLYGTASSYQLGSPTKPLYTIVMRFLMVVIPVYSLYNLHLITAMETSDEPQWIDSSLNFLHYIVTIWFCTKHYQLLEKIINGILKIYEEMKEYGKCVDAKEARFSITFTIIMLTLQCCVIILKIVAIDVSPAFHISIQAILYGFQKIVPDLYIIFISSLMRTVATQFNYLNNITTTFTCGIYERTIQNQTSSHTRVLGFVLQMYRKLLRIHNFISDYCTFILLFYVGHAFFAIASKTYYIFVWIISPQEISQSKVSLSFIIVVMHTLLIILLCHCFNLVARKVFQTSNANLFPQILARIHIAEKTNQNIIDNFLTSRIGQPVQFTARGFFTISNRTLFNIFSAVTTYLVILMQFKQLEENINHGQ